MIKYIKGTIFLILAIILSVSLDAMMKFTNTSVCDTLFLRFFFATIMLIPLLVWYKPKITLNTAKNHGIRAILFGISMFFYVTSLKILPMSVVTTINFSIPIWVVILAAIFLGESIRGRLITVFLGIIGIVLTSIPVYEKVNFLTAILLILSAIGFACLDVFNKFLMNQKESMLMMLFGSSLGISLLFLPFFTFKMPQNWWIFLLLGVQANLILYCFLKAWESCDIAALQPIKYLEFPLSFFIGSRIFNDITEPWIFAGMSFLAIALTLNIRQEIRQKTAKKLEIK